MRNGACGVRFLSWLLVIGCAAPPAYAVGEAYCNITAIRSDQLPNGVRVTIEADGAIPLNYDRLIDECIDFGKLVQTHRLTPDVLRPTDRISLSLRNARSHVGSFAYIGKYPVSHVEISVPPGHVGSFNLDIAVCLYRKLKLSRFPEVSPQSSLAALSEGEPRFEVSLSRDQQRIIIIALSDRQAEIRRRRDVEDVPPADRELRVSFENGLLDVHAKNARLSELLKAVTQATGEQMTADTQSERLVTAELPGVTIDEFCSRISECYGLAVDGGAERRLFGDMSALTTSAYTTVTTAQIPLRWLKPAAARDLLPNCLLDYVRAGSEQNALTVTGSVPLVEKVKKDLEKIDRPGKVVAVQAVLVESSTTEELATALALDYSGAVRDYRIAIDDAASSVVYSKVGVLEPSFRARLGALVASQTAKIKAESSVTLIGGETGEIFSGTRKYIQVLDIFGEKQAVPVEVGVRLRATAWTGGDAITVAVASEVSNIGEVDPLTGLPTVVTRDAQGTIRVRPGETIVIGGLSQVQNRSSVRRIPLLGSLPIVGRLFQRRHHELVRSELTVFLTPTLVGPQC